MIAPAILLAVSLTYRVDITTTDHQQQTILVADHSCGDVHVKAAARESFVRVCAQAIDDTHVRLEVERTSRDKQEERRASGVVIASSGTTFELLDAKLTLKTP